MTHERRLSLLKKTAAACVALLVLNYLVLEPGIAAWKRQSERIAELRQRVANGKQLKEREASLRERWAAMKRTNLPEENSKADDLALQAFGRWQKSSNVTFNRLTPQWQNTEDGSDLLKYNVSATGNQADIARFLYELESDPAIPVCLEEYELSTRDVRGSQLLLTARLSFLRLKDK